MKKLLMMSILFIYSITLYAGESEKIAPILTIEFEKGKPFNAFGLSRNANFLAIAQKSSVTLWDIKKEKIVQEILIVSPETETVLKVSVNNDGSTVVATVAYEYDFPKEKENDSLKELPRNRIYVWTTGKSFLTYSFDYANTFTPTAFNSDGSLFSNIVDRELTAGEIHAIDWRKFKENDVIQNDKILFKNKKSKIADYVSIEYQSNGVVELLYGNRTNTMLMREFNSTAHLYDSDKATSIPLEVTHKTWITSACFNSDDTILATGSEDGVIKLWDLLAKTLLKEFFVEKGPIKKVLFNNDSSLLIALSGKNTLTVWNSATGDKLKTFMLGTSYIKTLSISPHDKILISGDNLGIVTLLNLETYEVIATIKQSLHEILFAEITDDNKKLVVGSKQKITVYENPREPKNPEELFMQGDDYKTSEEFSDYLG